MSFGTTLRIVGPLCLGLALAGTAPAAPDSTGPVEHFPLEVGLWWQYRSVTAKGTTSEFTVKVMDMEKSRPPRYRVRTSSGMPMWDTYKKAGGWVFACSLELEKTGAQVEYEPARRYLRDPLVAGASWSWKGRGLAGVSIEESSVVDAEETVTVPAGTFKAMRVTSRVIQAGQTVDKIYWYAPGVGMVRSETRSGPIVSKTELVDRGAR